MSARHGDDPGALIVIDMINTYEHKDAEQLLPSVREVVPVITDLLAAARGSGAPVIYVNDNFGQWRSHHGELVEAAMAGPHADLVGPVRPDDDSLFVVKARHSIFYETPLTYLLWELGVRKVTLCGQVTEQCVLYSALDAHIRHLDVTVVADAVAHIHPHLAEAALEMMRINLGARITNGKDIGFGGGVATS
ncbi:MULTISPECIES: isochorismatase family cysteine hydrolase [Streptomyces]|uniref:Isochorismatase n=1 Tax=Streptomyces venezuelae TaxID=54571 RepID=A0A5P2B6R5_STRVZ|nr:MULTISPECIES: isochorismatase family cysteine hydrolase [Streptomyces]NEA02649.1 cysteine hydrolase [Streptomyces sp. SID10116]MYY86876.1 isochorismatase family protein [Streptomyces sp. SID335]MYZ18519.1 isochorismatase family protein [Streptomyces sp. SID337]NDZ89342.1 cysteine hydrolase [Streptomyces sp. SID10115]NEB46090.1 cysteine hydrolase [Streptomyces sp. SID339]